jgi:hypothetical protein
VDWWCLDSRGASSGILFMWDKKVVEKIDECVGGVYTMAVTFRNVEDHFTWAFAGGSMALILIGIEDCFGTRWLICLVGGTCLGALWVISTLLGSLVRDWEKLAHAQR